MNSPKYLPAGARLDKAVANAITGYLNRCQDVVAAYLFGSYARGTGRERSDIDVAVLFVGSEDKLQRFDRRLEIIIDLERVTGKKVDVIDIQAAPLLLQHQILKDGILLVDKNPRYRVAFEVWSRRTYFDLQSFLERRNKKIIAKVLESGLNG
ncbi:type VII toxin-antitoxin system MntA family adenylyltransferase antitoxin [Moorella stamsii]|uniref:type VII toxin-antitoxin system MntA family adenylyltransferase antitoxin n=1 Tax=Neomoorella stamsii TaxID=1266720 RepID=UPI0006D5870C|nr:MULTISPECIES: nucleotidyltransferase domain-containing protein [Moorella]